MYFIFSSGESGCNMNPKMIVTSGYPEMTAYIKSIVNELKYDVTFVEGTLEEAAREVAALVAKDTFEVIISRAGTAHMIRKLVDLPIIYSDSTHYDFIKAFRQAKEISDDICFITYPEEGFMFDFEEIFEVLGFRIDILTYKTKEELVSQVKKAKDMGIKVVVGGGIRASEMARHYGMQSVHLTIGNRQIRRALILGYEVALKRLTIRYEAEKLKSIINSSEDGILVINQAGEIETCNKVSERIFQVSERKIIGKKGADLGSEKLSKLLAQSKIYNLNYDTFTWQDLLITSEPVVVLNERVGTVLICREFSGIQKMEKKVRGELAVRGLYARFSLHDIIHTSTKMKEVIQLIQEFSKSDSTTLIIGESGTGKELIAQSIHNLSVRKSGPFVAVNCAALPENLLESELFGYAEGAFTGAKKGGRQGYFELAHEGTIFLDEIGEIPPHIQTRLLRVLQEREVMRVGGDRITPINIRVIAATNQKLWELVKEGKFREDLYFRLSVLHIQVPSLRERKEDIPVLINKLLTEHGSKLTFEELSDNLKNFFMNYQWPGNVRQLENIVERYCLRNRTDEEEKKFIADCLRETDDLDSDTSSDGFFVQYGTMEEIEKQVIKHMLKKHDNKRTIVAENLGISRTTVWKKINDEITLEK